MHPTPSKSCLKSIRADWKEDLADQRAFFAKIGPRYPKSSRKNKIVLQRDFKPRPKTTKAKKEIAIFPSIDQGIDSLFPSIARMAPVL